MSEITEWTVMKPMRVGQGEVHVLIDHEQAQRLHLVPYPAAIRIVQQLLQSAMAIQPKLSESMHAANDGLIHERKHEAQVFLFLDLVRSCVGFFFVGNAPVCFLRPDVALDLAAGLHTMIDCGQHLEARNLLLLSRQLGNETEH